MSTSQLIAELNERIEKAILISIEVSKTLPDELAKANKLLADRGWYMPYFISESRQIIENSYLLKTGKHDELDQIMAKFIDDCIPVYEKRVYNLSPEREEIFHQIFRAHRSKNYYLTVPVIYAQLDGLTENIIGARLFKNQTKKNKPSIVKFISDIDSDFKKKYLFPWLGYNEQNRNQIPKNPSGANRHDVLHGSSSDYGTHINSCKALSLLFLLTDTVLRKGSSNTRT